MAGYCCHTFWRLSLAMQALITGMLCMAGQVNAAAPDLTTRGVPNDSVAMEPSVPLA